MHPELKGAKHVPISVFTVILRYEKLCRAPISANDGIFL